ncbi:MAG: hypothetical protein IE922_14465 [Sphingomonadales bacterium]|nr:hypothetical protein [Sphingomonadales bacterium]
MKTILDMRRRKVLTEQQVLTAARYHRNPTAFRLAPTLHRIMHDIVISEAPLETYEEMRGWPARSAKAIISTILFAMEEAQGDHYEPREEDRASIDDLREKLDWLTGSDVVELAEAMQEHDLTPLEGRMFLILRHQIGKWIAPEIVMRRMYSDRLDADMPEPKLFDVFLCKLRKKVAAHYEIRRTWGGPIMMVELSAADGEPLAAAPERRARAGRSA